MCVGHIKQDLIYLRMGSKQRNCAFFILKNEKENQKHDFVMDE